MTQAKFQSACYAVAVLIAPAASALAIAPEVLEAEAERVEVVERVSQSTVAIFDSQGQGGGSGVLISPDGYALTNFHVVAPCGAAMKCGLDDGKLYDAVLVGMDPPGDVALIQLLGRDDFPAAQLGDSDTASVGDEVLVVGNPFLLAEDYQPTVTFGIVSGTHRYQYPAGTLLEYADCLQTDAAINPGNSGGPMFDIQGRLIGVNGRGSFEKRGRVNVGVGYAISINQIKRFLSHLKAGRVVDHATLGATVSTVGAGRVIVDDILERSDAYRRGLRYGDYLTSFAGRDMTSANALKNALGTFPALWQVPIEMLRDGEPRRAVVRLESLHRQGELEALIEQQSRERVPIEPPGPEEEDPEQPMPQLPDALTEQPAPLPDAVQARYEERSGFANYWYNRRQQQRLTENCRQWNSFAADNQLVIDATDSLGQPVRLEATDRTASYRSVRGQFFARFDDPDTDQTGPPGSGGLLAAACQWRKLVAHGLDGFDDAYYLGQLPFGPRLEMHDCLVAIDRGRTTRFYFDPDLHDLVGMEHVAVDDRDPCQVLFADFQPWDAGRLPFAWRVRFGDNDYVEFNVDAYQQPPAETPPAEESPDE